MSTSNNMGRTTQAQPKPGVNVCIVKKEIDISQSESEKQLF